MAADTLELSIVIPVYNEEPNLPEMIRRTLAACEEMKRSYEIILVDDGSMDQSVSMIEEASRNHPGKVIGVILTTNFGQHAAVTAASIFANTSSRVCVHIVHDDTLTAANISIALV